MRELAENLKMRFNIYEGIVALLSTFFVLGCGYLQALEVDIIVRNTVLCALIHGTLGVVFRNAFYGEKLDYDNNENLNRLFIIFLFCNIFALLIPFIPSTGWPYQVIYVVLALYSSPFVGGMTATLLLILSVLLAGEGVLIFSMYLISGILCIVLFSDITEKFNSLVPMIVSGICLIVCEAIPIVLYNVDFWKIDLYVIPMANLLVSIILIYMVLRDFFQKVIYKDRLIYIDLLNPESDVLKKLKEDKKREYYISIHTGFFSERIADKLALNSSAIKTCALYHNVPDEHLPPLPSAAQQIMKEFKGSKQISSKEVVILHMSKAIIEKIYSLLDSEQYKGKAIPYESVIEEVFESWRKSGRMDSSNMTLSEVRQMKKTFKEEKLYYDFLR